MNKITDIKNILQNKFVDFKLKFLIIQNDLNKYLNEYCFNILFLNLKLVF